MPTPTAKQPVTSSARADVPAEKRLHANDHLAFALFLDPNCVAKQFQCATNHPSQPTGFCPCDQGWAAKSWFYIKATLLITALRLPFNPLKLALLRRLGAKISQKVYLSVDSWIDPTFPQLLTIENEVMIGVGARIFLHEFRRDSFHAGRVTIRKGVIIGAFSLIGPGLEIGENAVVAPGAVVGRDVPPGKLAIGNPARVVNLQTNHPHLE